MQRFFNHGLRFTVVFLMLSGAAQAADEFTLFDSKRGKNEAVEQAKPQVKAQPVKRKLVPGGSQPHFELRGMSRFGKRYSVILQAPDGRTVIRHQWREGDVVDIEGYPGYRLFKAGNRQVELVYPEDKPCNYSSDEKGVNCSDNGRVATLTMARAEPTAPKVVEPPKPATPDKADGDKKEAAQTPPNPFAAAITRALEQRKAEEAADPELAKQRREAQKQRLQRATLFGGKTIRPEDVPEGKRVISTPFGDRLVDQ